MARYQTGIRTEAAIVDATRELLAEVGMEATTVKAICDRAEIQSGSFYNVFSSKEQVLLRSAISARLCSIICSRMFMCSIYLTPTRA